MTTTKFEDLTIKEILEFAAEDDIDSNELAFRLVKRLALAEKQIRKGGHLYPEEAHELKCLVKVTDCDL